LYGRLDDVAIEQDGLDALPEHQEKPLGPQSALVIFRELQRTLGLSRDFRDVGDTRAIKEL
jgi:hypothetical protein